MSQASVEQVFQQALQDHSAKRIEDAARGYRAVLAREPRHAHSLHMLGRIACDEGRLDEAEELIQRAIAIDDKVAVFHRTLGATYKAQRRGDEAIAAYVRSLVLKPNALAALNLGELHQDRLQYEDAMRCYRQVLELDPGNISALSNMTAIFTNLGMMDKVFSMCGHILERDPENHNAHNNLAVAYKAAGNMAAAISHARRAVASAPQSAIIYSNMLLMMVYADFIPPEELAEASRGFGSQIADDIAWMKHDAINRDPARRLRIGFVSPDFFSHAVNYFFEPLLVGRSRDYFEYFAYSNVSREDDVTERLRHEFDHWRDIRFLPDEKVAEVIASDGIDILVDLAGHTANNRLLVFARKPAPVQVTWLGYPATTGMKAMDYRITDSFAEPPGMTEQWNVEELWRLPRIFCCYQPHADSPAVIDHPPFRDNGYITFGCFNNFSKVTDDTLEAWARIMVAVPDSRLLLEVGSLTEFRPVVEDKLRRAGMPMDRVDLEPRRKENQFVLYNCIDMALDPFPCCGGTTSMDTLWMGVPFVTLAGVHFVSRMGVTILNNAGLPELIAADVDEYVAKAVALAKDRARLESLRSGLRQRIAKTPLMDTQAFVKDMEDAFRGMWRKFCAQVAA
jgi:predicted O-linked N-acetylglucosamine transferase (SPINDLY family)